MKENIINDKSLDFALEIIDLYKKLIKKNEFVLSKQLLRSATSIGANIQESSAAASRKDFINKLTIASKEARETKYWLILLDKSNLVELNYSEHLNKVEELIRLLTAIIKTSSLQEVKNN